MLTLFKRKRSKFQKVLENDKKFLFEHKKLMTTITYRKPVAVYQLDHCLVWTTTYHINKQVE